MEKTTVLEPKYRIGDQLMFADTLKADFAVDILPTLKG